MRLITKRFGGTLALDAVNLSVEAGEVHALAGENGSGKSTLMRILAGVIPADDGEILVNGARYRPSNPALARHLGIAMIHQELSICPHLTVAENVLLGIEQTTGGVIRGAQQDAIARRALEPLGLAHLDLSTPAGKLPIGVQQLIEIARSIAVSAKLVILDEPTSSLTESDVVKLFEVIKRLRASGIGVIYISHFLSEMRELADRVTILRDGRQIAVKAMAEVSDDEIVSLMVGRSIEDMYPRSAHSPAETVLEVQHLFGKKLPRNSSLALRKGEVIGIAGLNGSGRTEFIRTIFGLDPVEKGEITIGKYQGPKSPSQRWQEGVGFLSENRKEEGLAVKLSIRENMVMTKRPKWLVNDVAEQSAARQWIQALAVRCQGPEQTIGDLSGGNQQKVAIARMLYHDVDVFLLDEPTRGIDVGSKAQIYKLIDELALAGKSIIVISSYMPELLGICDRIAVMHRGELTAARPTEQWDQEKLLHEAIGS